jgi:hypothetical protein
MKKETRLIFAIACCIILLGSCQKETITADQSLTADVASLKKAEPATKAIFATGLNNPRSLKFGPDGYLYVAEAGTGGTTNNVAICPQLQPPFPFGPYTGSTTGGRISRISSAGLRTTVTDQLPSSSSNPIIGDIMGVGDIAFIGDQLYALMAGAGCSHGVPTVPNGILRINSNGTHPVVADLGTWEVNNPAANPEPDDFEPEGVWYSMLNVRGDFYALEPNHGEFVKVSPDGTITRIVDLSAELGHIVPTALAYHGNFFVGNLNTFPIEDGSSSVYKITPSGQVEEWATGFSTILGLAFDNAARLYVLEMTAGSTSGFPEPGKSRVVRVNPNGTHEVIATGLSFATGMTMGPDGNLYVSNWGFGRPPGGGEIWKITLN